MSRLRVEYIVTADATLPVEFVVGAGSPGPLPPIPTRPVRPPAEWTLVLCDEAGIELLEITDPPKLTLTRNRTPEVEVATSPDDEAAIATIETLANGLPRLRAYRRGDGNADLRFYGRWAPSQEEAAADNDSMQLAFKGPGGVLDRRWTDAVVSYAATDQGAILWNLISRANTATPTGITQGSIPATVNRDRTYERKNLTEAITELTEVINGPDYEIVPTYNEVAPDPAILGRLDVFDRQGVDRSREVVFEFGADTAGNVQRVRRSILLPVNHVIVLGADGLVGEATDQASIAKYGRCSERVDATTVSEQATLTAKAQGALRPAPIRVLEFEPDPDSAPRPFDDFWLGDTVTLRIRYGSIYEDEPVRINQIVVTPDDTGREDYTVAVEAPEAEGPLRLPPDPRRPFTSLRQEVRDLAQRAHRLP